MKKLLLLFISALLAVSVQAQSSDKPGNWKLIVSDEYPADDVGVATYDVVADFGADPTGVKDSWSIFQTALNKLGENRRGGVLFVPAGRYRITGKLYIPTGVTLRGEWKRPTKGVAIQGTILMVDNAGGDELESKSFITMEPSTALTYLSIWYPHQNPDHIKPYPPTVLYGRDGVWGNEYCNVRHVTLVNSYSGIILSRKNGGGCPNIYDVYGTPLSRGIEIDNIADVGRFEQIYFSPDYWAGSGLEGAPKAGSAFTDWIYQNGVGITMRRNDWSYTCFVDVEGYNCGFKTGNSMSGDGNPNGHNYSFHLKDCQTGIHVDGSSSSGIMFTRVEMENCENGIVVSSADGPVQLYGCEISARENAVLMESGSSSRLMMEQCTVKGGAVNSMSGDFVASDCDFNNTTPQVFIGSDARCILKGNRFAKKADVQNNSLFECHIDHTALTERSKLPEFPDLRVPETKPARVVLYNVLDFGIEPFVVPFNSSTNTQSIQNAIRNGLNSAKDATAAIQSALDKAKADGGGIVYLPGGRYKMLGTLTVPTGVELRGAADFGSIPRGHGTIFEVYAGKGQPSGESFLKLEAGSGVRGISINYPEQLSSMLPAMAQYPYTIQGKGKDIYIVNVGIRAAWNGLDLFSNKCDNHYVDYLAGHAFKNVIRIGGGSQGGMVNNMQFNTIVYACGAETKFGSWSNNADADNGKAYDQNMKELRFITVEDCTDEILYNDFHYGGYEGIVFDKSGAGRAASGKALGLGIDGSMNSAMFNALGSAGFPLVNTQLVALEAKSTAFPDTRYITLGETFTGNAEFYGIDLWGGPKHSTVINNGNLVLNLANFSTTGNVYHFYLPKSTGKARMHNAVVNMKSDASIANSSHEKQAFVGASVLDVESWRIKLMGEWDCNLTLTPVFEATDALLSRTKWSITANVNNGNARNAIDNNVSTRWDTGQSQKAGQMVTVNMNAANKLNRIILDSSKSPGDGPAGYELYVKNGANADWKLVAEGKIGTSVLIIGFPEETATHFKIIQTGTKGGYWSIHELYAALVDDTPTSISSEVIESAGEIYYYDGRLAWSGLKSDVDNQVEIIDLSGRRILSQQVNTNSLQLSGMQGGFYIVVVSDGTNVLRKKLFFKD